MIEMRWVLTREQEAGAFSEPIPWSDGTTVFARIQYRERNMADNAPWAEIPVISEISAPPALALVNKRRGH